MRAKLIVIDEFSECKRKEIIGCSPYLTFNKKKLQFEVEGGPTTRKEEAWTTFDYRIGLVAKDFSGMYMVFVTLTINKPASAIAKNH